MFHPSVYRGMCPLSPRPREFPSSPTYPPSLHRAPQHRLILGPGCRSPILWSSPLELDFHPNAPIPAPARMFCCYLPFSRCSRVFLLSPRVTVVLRCDRPFLGVSECSLARRRTSCGRPLPYAGSGRFPPLLQQLLSCLSSVMTRFSPNSRSFSTWLFFFSDCI